VRQLHDAGIVRREEEGGIRFLIDFAHQFDYFACGMRVEVGSGLVGEDDTRFFDKGARDGDALLLTTRKLGG
jgi:hypothetical protein